MRRPPVQRSEKIKINVVIDVRKLCIAIWALTVVVIGELLLPSTEANAVPSFARQTGQTCGRCHTDFPQLTPFGRRFKLGGYTLGGGRDSSDYKKVFGSGQWVPPISIMGIASYTKTNAGQPDTTPSNNYVSADQFSVFYAGSITDDLGAFVQSTLAGNGGGFSLDNTDIRYVKSGTLFGKDALFGITLHNNPTVQDAWNTMPAWGFPFVSSGFAPSPAAATALEGNFAGRVIGIGGYTFIDDMIYLEATVYKGFDRRWQSALGVWDRTALSSVMDRVSPYFRVAVEPHWGNHWLMVGAFMLSTSVNPLYVDMANTIDPVGYTVAGTDKYIDAGFDAQYQYMGDNVVLTLRGIYIHEKQKLDATFANGGSDNSSNTLNSFKAQASYAWNTDAPGNKWVFTGGYFNTWGSTDCLLYAGLPSCVGSTGQTGSPNSNGWIAEIAWFPYAVKNSPVWPWFNARVGLQYIWYNKFDGATANYDGAGRNASDNNTLFMYVWFAM